MADAFIIYDFVSHRFETQSVCFGLLLVFKAVYDRGQAGDSPFGKCKHLSDNDITAAAVGSRNLGAT